jgi:hypothetical protein
MIDLGSRYRTPNTRMLELALLVCLFLFFLQLAASRIWELRVAAEKTGMAQTLASIQSALGIQLAAIVVREGIEGIVRLEGSNPMELLDSQPFNYLGELNNPEPGSIHGHTWYFDTTQRLLVYRVLYDDYFDSELDGAPRARFQLKLNFDDINENGQFDPKTETFSGLVIKPLEPYGWRIDF